MGEGKNTEYTGTTALAAVSVLDLTQSEPGAEASLSLAWLGADVIKIELPKGQEDPNVELVQDSTLDRILRADKKLLTLDISAKEGYEILKKLAADADIVLTDGSPRSVSARGIDYESIKAINEDVVYARINSFPDDSPYVESPINEGTAQSVGGFSAVTGETGGAPLIMDFNIGGSITATNVCICVLAAVMQRYRTGEGQKIEVFSSNALSTINRGNLGVAAANHRDRPRMGTTMAHISLLDSYKTGDGNYCILFCSPMTEEPWHAFAKTMGKEELIEDPKFCNNKARCANRAELDGIILDWMSQYTNIEVMERCGANGVVCGAVLTPEQIMENESLRSIDVVIDAVDAEGNSYTIPGNPIIMSDATRPKAEIHAVGQDTDGILAKIGLTDTQIGTLRAEGII